MSNIALEQIFTHTIDVVGKFHPFIFIDRMASVSIRPLDHHFPSPCR